MVFKLAFQKLKKKLNSYFTDSTLDEFDVWLFSIPNNIGINDKLVYGSNDTKKEFSLMEHISTTSKFIAYENTHGRLDSVKLINKLENNIKKISQIRGIPTIAYLTAINKKVSSELINISDDDIKQFVNLINDIPNEIQEINIVLHSRGGYMISARQIAEIIRDRFKRVTYIIPYMAHSAASMICMTADEIIMTPESSMSPFDVQILSPVSNDYYPATKLVKIAKDARKRCSFFKLFTQKNLCDDWEHKKIERVIFECNASISITKNYTLYWLMKYFFKSFKNTSYSMSNYIVIPIWKRFSKNGRAANKIVRFFTNLNIHIVHNNPIMYHEIKDIGLNISCADEELLSILRETYILADDLFLKSNIVKLYINDNKHLYIVETANS